MASSFKDIRDVFRAEQHRHRAEPTPATPGCDDLVPVKLGRGDRDSDRTRVRISIRRVRKILAGEPTYY